MKRLFYFATFGESADVSSPYTNLCYVTNTKTNRIIIIIQNHRPGLLNHITRNSFRIPMKYFTLLFNPDLRHQVEVGLR
jgi:hypothetical protein